MNLIRYAIRKEDLHSLLRTIGVLQKTERLLAVNNLDLTDPKQDIVVVTVTTEAGLPPDSDVSTLSEKQIQQRLTELAILEDAATRQLRMIVEELYRLRRSSGSRMNDHEVGGDEIPDSVERNIRDQLRTLLSGDGRSD